MVVQLKSALIILAVAFACSPRSVLGQDAVIAASDQPASSAEQKNESKNQIPEAGQPSPGSLSGTVVDPSGAVVAGAQVQLTGGAQRQQTVSGSDGQFFFPNVAPGEFKACHHVGRLCYANIFGNAACGRNRNLAADRDEHGGRAGRSASRAHASRGSGRRNQV